jgi:putative hydrolase of the HAD superfamily
MDHYSTVFLDLDETLYPKPSPLWIHIGERINTYLLERVGINEAEVEQLRNQYLQEYGTTLKGLMQNHGVDPHDYLDFVHQVPVERIIEPDPGLRNMLAEISPRRVIFTNASSQHAQRVLQRLGVEELIDQIIDIETLDFANKPLPQAYLRALRLVGETDAERCLMVDDRLANLLPAKTIGMTTVLVGDDSGEAGADYTINAITQLTATLPQLKDQHGQGADGEQ